MVYRQHGMDGNIGCVVLPLYLKFALSTHVCTVHPLYPTAAAPDLNIGCLRAHCHQVRCHLCQLLLVEPALGQGLFGRKAGLEDEAPPERPCRCSEGQHLTVQVDEPQRVSHSILQPGCGACRSCWLKARQSALLTSEHSDSPNAAAQLAQPHLIAPLLKAQSVTTTQQAGHTHMRSWAWASEGSLSLIFQG